MSDLSYEYLTAWAIDRQQAAAPERCRYCRLYCSKSSAWHGLKCAGCDCPSSIKEHRS